MAAEAQRRITVEEYFAILAASPVKLDFIGGQVVDPWAMEEGSPEAMAGGKIRHGLIASNLLRELGPTADARGCIVLTSDVQVRLNEREEYCFPDLTVVCGEIDDEERTIESPVLVVEVLSPSTQDYDKGLKFDQYLLLPSIEEIVFVHQEKPQIEGYRRHGGVWVYERVEGVEGQIEMLGTIVPLRAAYRRVKFQTPNPPHAA